MGKKRKRIGPHFTKEAKMKAIELLERGDVTAVQLSRDLGVSERTLYRWKIDVPQAEGAERLTAAERQKLKRLEKENERLKLEVEILKKARTFSANRRS
jgi:transposase